MSRMWRNARGKILRSGILIGTAAAALACPVCDTETGKQVREGIFGEGFAQNAVAVGAPLPILMGLALFVSHWLGKEDRRV